MPDMEKVIKGFTVCSEHGLLNGEDCHGHYEYTDNLADIIKANDYSKQCPYNGCETGCVKTLAKDVFAILKEQEYKDKMFHALEDDWKRLNELLKEQEAVEPILIREGRNKNYNDYVCPCCDNEVAYEQNYCSECGVRFLWEGR